MISEAERVLEAALRLSRRERAELATLLADTIADEGGADEVPAAWLAEAKKRLEAIRAGETIPVPWQDVERY